MNLLFVCNQGRHRSRTAAELLGNRYTTRYVGLFNETPISKNDLGWAELVFVMEDHQRTEISRRFPREYLRTKIISLDIPDFYSYNQGELRTLIESRIKPFLPLPKSTPLIVKQPRLRNTELN